MSILGKKKEDENKGAATTTPSNTPNPPPSTPNESNTTSEVTEEIKDVNGFDEESIKKIKDSFKCNPGVSKLYFSRDAKGQVDACYLKEVFARNRQVNYAKEQSIFIADAKDYPVKPKKKK